MYFFLAAAPKLIVFRYSCVKGRLLSHKPFLPPPPPASLRLHCKGVIPSLDRCRLTVPVDVISASVICISTRSRGGMGRTPLGFLCFVNSHYGVGGSHSVPMISNVRAADSDVPETHLALSLPWS